MDTTPCTGKRDRRHKERWEYYMVDDKLWAALVREDSNCIEDIFDAQFRLRFSKLIDQAVEADWRRYDNSGQ